jgi:CDP-glucose 4,6-dehydratase
MEDMAMNASFWRDKRVFITGHTGFKGAWLSLWLQSMGADVTGYALSPNTDPNLFTLASVADGMTSIISDICDAQALAKALRSQQPDIVLHLAAQPLVRLSYEQPAETLATNIMGTVNLLEALREQESVRAIVVITSDKCYENREWIWGYRENEAMGGRDPYSCSKACVELICAAYRDSFFNKKGIALATARAGNVIGGGDWSSDRLVPDILKAIETKSTLMIRNPLATRPWQHVLEPLGGYLLLAERLWSAPLNFSSAWNFGPPTTDVCSVQSLIERLSFYCESDVIWKQTPGELPHEAHLLSLDSSKAKTLLGWESRWDLGRALAETANWHQAFLAGSDMRDKSLQQINNFCAMHSL